MFHQHQFIRLAQHADISRLIQIRAAVRENVLSDPSKVTVADYEWFVQYSLIWVWDENGVRGFAAGDIRDGWIWALFVDPAFESLGIGGALLAQACQSLKDAGYKVATLSTDRGSRAERFYLKAGWVISAADETKKSVVFTTTL